MLDTGAAHGLVLLAVPGGFLEPGERRTQRAGHRVFASSRPALWVGRAVARRFAAAGDRVALLARGADGLDAAADEAARRWGPVDVWVNNAFAGALAPVTALTPAEGRPITEVTYLGYVHGTMAALRQMMPRDQGTIVHVGSALGYRGIPLQSAYCCTRKSGVRTTMVVLPALNTPQLPGQDRFRQPADRRTRADSSARQPAGTRRRRARRRPRRTRQVRRPGRRPQRAGVAVPSPRHGGRPDRSHSGTRRRAAAQVRPLTGLTGRVR